MRMRATIKSNGEEYYEYILYYMDNIICMLVKATKVMKEIRLKFKFNKGKIKPLESYLGARLPKRTL